MKKMSESEIEAAAKCDPDNKPWSPEELARAKHTPRSKLRARAQRLREPTERGQ